MKREIAFRINREAMGLSQKDIADFAKVSTATVSKYEKGEPVSEVYAKRLEDTLRSTKDKIYKNPSRERSELMVRIYERLWEASESQNDKKKFLNKLLVSIAFIQEDDIWKERDKYSTSFKGNGEYVFRG